jgi:putative chitinase
MTPEEWKPVLYAIAPQAKEWIVLGLADAMPTLVKTLSLNTTDRQAHFLAQLAHESDHFKTTEEYATGAAYEGRRDLGNTQPGDGKRFKGRGLIQLTGRANYAAASKALGEDYVGNPELVERFPAAAIVSGWFWDSHELNRHADNDDILAVTKAINGGTNGLDSRVAHLDSAKAALA